MVEIQFDDLNEEQKQWWMNVYESIHGMRWFKIDNVNYGVCANIFMFNNKSGWHMCDEPLLHEILKERHSFILNDPDC